MRARTDRTTVAPPASAGVAVGWPRRSEVVGWLLGTALITGTALYLALSLGHGVPAPGPADLPEPGRLTEWALPALRAVADLTAVLTVGLLLTATLLLPSPEGTLSGLALRASRAAAWSALAWATAAVAEAVFTASDILAEPVRSFPGPSAVLSTVLQIPQGKALLWQAGLAFVVAMAVRWTLRTREAVWVLLVAVVALAPPVLTGHAASSGAHGFAVVSLLVHVVAASLWVGGLVGVTWVAVRGSRRLGAAVGRYSVLAAWCLAVVIVSGVGNAAIRLGWGDLFTSSYGALVIVKAAAVVALGGLGLLHRRRTLVRLGPPADDAAGQAVGARRAFTGLAVVEVAVMAATIAVAVALSRTPTPSTGQVYTDPVTELLGRALPAAPSVHNVLFGFFPDALGMLLVGMGLALYAQGLRVLRRRGDRWPAGRTASWVAGLAVLGWSTFGGLGEYSHVLFSAHMVAHMLLSMVTPILLVLGAPVTLALRTLPGARVPGEQGPRQLLLGVLHSHVVRVLTHPVAAAVLFVGSLYAVYFTSLFGWLMGSPLGHAAMELHFLGIGALFFYVLVGIDPGPRTLAPLWRFGLLLFVMPFHAFFSIALMSSSSLLGGSYWQSLHRPYASDLLGDQVFAGGASWALGELPIVIVAVAVFVQWVRGDAREARRTDRAADRAAGAGVDDELARYNAYLARLNAPRTGVGGGRADERR